MEIVRKLFLVLLLAFPTILLAAGPVNINTADKEALTAVKGVGEKRAEAIIAYRKQHGPFKSVDELAAIKGIGQATIDANRETLSISDN